MASSKKHKTITYIDEFMKSLLNEQILFSLTKNFVVFPGPEIHWKHFSFWTAGTNLQENKSSDRNHIWYTTGEPFNYLHWSTKQPDNGRGEPNIADIGNQHCVIFIRLLPGHTGWDDFNCEETLPFVCQKKIF